MWHRRKNESASSARKNRRKTMVETWNGVGFLVKLEEPQENGDRHFSAQGEGDLYASGIYATASTFGLRRL